MLKVKLDVVRGALTGVTAGLDLRSIEMALGDELPPLQAGAGERAGAAGSAGPDGQRVAFDNLRVALAGRPLDAPFSAGLAWDGHSREFFAQALRLSGWQSVLPSLPMEDALRQRLQALQPQGVVDDVEVALARRAAGPGQLQSGRRTLAASAWRHPITQPGVAHLSGRIEGDAQAGVFEIDSPQLVIDLPMLFREPRFGLRSSVCARRLEKNRSRPSADTGRGRVSPIAMPQARPKGSMN